MRYRTLGQTGLGVSEVGIGAFPLSGEWTRADGSVQRWSGVTDAESIALIHRAEELGVNLIDTAEGYGNGHSEEVVGAALHGARRAKWIVATKVQPNRGQDRDTPDPAAAKERIVSACEESLRRLGMETIDLYQLHAIPHAWASGPVMEALAELRAAGKVRWYGVSTNNRTAIDALREHGPVHVLQIGYNLLERAADELLHWSRQEEIGTLIRVPLAKGWLTGKYFDPSVTLPEEDVRYERFTRPEARAEMRKLPQLAFLGEGRGRTMVQAALRFVLDHPGVSCVIAGAKTRAQIHENTAASGIPPLAADELRRALAIAETIRTPGWT